MELWNRVVLVTGASSGIGAATAREFARAGARVALVARREELLKSLAIEIGEPAYAYRADLSTPEAAVDLADRIRTELGVPDVIVNNAGAGSWRFVDETTPQEFHAMAAVPYLAAGYVTTAFAGDMVRRGSGRIVVVNSPVSRITWPGAFGYASARWALRGLVRALEADLRGTGVGVTEVVPGKVSSDYFLANPGSVERIPRVATLIPEVTPEQVARALVNATRARRARVQLPFALRLFLAQSWATPRLVDWIAGATGARR